MAFVARLRTPFPIAVSVLLHGVAIAFLLRTPPVSANESPAVPEAWAGNTFDLDLDGIEPGKGAEAPPAAPPAAAADAPAPPVEAPVAPIEAKPSEPVAPPPVRKPPAPKKERDLDETTLAPPTEPPAVTKIARPPAKKSAARPGGDAAEAGDAGDGKKKGGTFGAEGPIAARDIGNAFTRAIAPANQADAAWSKLSVGPAGTVDIAISVDESGHVGDAEPVSKVAPTLLVALAKRTLLLLRGGVFHLKGGEATAGRQILRLHADVSDVDASAVLGGTIDLAFSYERGRGKAAFTRPGGRHVEVSVTLLRVEAQPAL